jgi:4-hydroxy-3-methylbut-2-enyl diphosphate reductase
MGRKFDIPEFYRSSLVSSLKAARRSSDQRKRDFSPTMLTVGRAQFVLARHFGFCFGVENAIERAYRALEENPGKRVFLLSEMIHNPHVNADLVARGVRFLLTPEGEQLIPFEGLTPEDIVIVPAFGTTVDLFKRLEALGVDVARYNATCPFVEKVWKRAEQLGSQGFTIVIHGKHSHEETRATFSHAQGSAPSLVIRDLAEAATLSEFISGARPTASFHEEFAGRYSEGFDPSIHLQRIGVVNQTTMLATETLEISSLLKKAMHQRFPENPTFHFADTRDTLCYATSENQNATLELMNHAADFAVVVGGYNSSNTSHLVELLETHVSTFYIKDEAEIISALEIRHLDLHAKEVRTTSPWLPAHAQDTGRAIRILLTAGASCPDSLVDRVMQRLCELLGVKEALEPSVTRLIAQLRAAEIAPRLSIVSS